MRNGFFRWLRTGAFAGSAIAAGALAATLAATTAFGIAGAGPRAGDGDTPTLAPGATPLQADNQAAEELLTASEAFLSRRLAGNIPLDNQQAGALRAEAARAAARIRKEGLPASGPSTFSGAWRQIGPNPIVQVTRGSGTFSAMSGRIGALAIRPSNGQYILGAAQGGIWTFDTATGTWSPKSSSQETQAIGALAVAPSDDTVVYAGTGEGALSGDSYFGNGIMKSTDGGNTWSHVSGDYFRGVSVTQLAVDPTNKDHLYASISRGRGGARRTSPEVHSRYGVWESKDGAATWELVQEVKDSLGATDVELDPQNPSTVYTTFWSDAIYRSKDGGETWSKIMAGLPLADWAAALTRFSIDVSRPSASSPAVLYAGFDWVDAAGYHPSRVFKSTNGGDSWTILPAGTTPEKVEDYCGGQCFYDNVIEADPTDPNVVFAAGQFDYGIGSGGIFRSDDGGMTWRNLGWDQHPDFHALAFDPANTNQVVVGSDGGVWSSANRGGRQAAGSPLASVTWQNLNGGVNPNTAGITGRTNLAIAQFTSIATVPQFPGTSSGAGRFWGGTQDNGTMRKTGGTGQQWFDVASGDGGQVVVDHTADACGFLSPSCFVYGTYFNVSPYRYSDGGNFFTNQALRTGINTGDRSDFYIPMVLNRLNPNQLFLGTYRLYRTDTARAASASDVRFKTISGDLTSGCTGTAPNGARNCSISAIGVGGGSAVYVGTLDGYVQVAYDGQTSDTPTWTRVDRGELPARPVSSIAVDRSNYRTAYLGYNGFNAATPSRPGHVYRTLDGGRKWADITGNLPDSPVNSLILDPSYPNTLYAGTDVGPFVTYNGGATWSAMGGGFPLVAVWQLDLDPYHRVMAAGTHGRGAYSLVDTISAPALVLSKVDAGTPAGPTSNVTYTLTLQNIGNAAANAVTITDPVPANTTFVSADSGGTNNGGTVTWTIPTIPSGGSATVHFTVSIAPALKNKVDAIVNDGFAAKTADGFSTTGSPFVTPIAPPYAVTASPAAQTDGGRVGTSVPYKLTISNRGFNADSYNLSATSAYATSFFDATCTTPITSTGTIAAGGSSTVCAKVAVPSGAANDATNTGTVTATSAASSGVSASATLTTIAVAVNTLLVDNDDNNPNVQPYYTAALDGAGLTGQYSKWDLAANKNLPLNYTKSFKNIVWFTGNSYPGPILPYESTLQAFLDDGGRLLMSGHDILDQAAGTTAFVHDYLHITWDGTETQNDKPTASVQGVAGNPVTNGLGTIPLDHSVLGAAFEDRITPNGTAQTAFTDDTAQTNALSYAGTYKVVFLAFALESYGTAAQKADLVGRSLTFFGP